MNNRQYQFTTEEVKVLPSLEIEDRKRRSNRLIPSSYMRSYDPIVMFEEYFIQPPAGFITMANKGVEMVNYIYDGGLDHKNEQDKEYNTILEGELIRYTTGKGLSHSERPVNRGINHGIQIWIVLPDELRDMDPDFQICHEKDFHVDTNDTRYIKTIAGNNSPLKLNSEVEIQDILLYENSKMEIDIKPGHNGFVYVISGVNGELYNSDFKIKPSEAMVFENVKSVTLESGEWATRFIYVSAKPQEQVIPDFSEFVI